MAFFHVIKILSLSILFLGGSYAAENDGALEKGLINPGFHEKPGWFKNSFLDLQEDLAEAEEVGKRIILFFYQDGCPYCTKLLNVNFTQQDIVEKTRDNFEVIAINIWGDKEVVDLQGQTTTEKSFSTSLKVMYTPTLLFLNEQGEVVLRVNGYFPPHKFKTALAYVAGHFEGKSSFRDYLTDVQPVAAVGTMHHAPGFLSRPLDLKSAQGKSAKPLLVLMEQKQCPRCDELHTDILQRDAVKASLTQFDVALVDIWSAEILTTPAGLSMRSTDWAAERKIHYAPSLLFFDDKGREVFRTDAFLKTFHIHAAMDYVLNGAYITQPSFQRFVQARAEALREEGIEPDLMD